MEDIIREFVLECLEGLDHFDRDLLELEKAPGSDVLVRVFRCIHSIKGAAGCLGFCNLESLAHVGENLLSKLRDREIQFTPAMANALLKMADRLRKSLVSIQKTGADQEPKSIDLIEELNSLLQSASAPAAPSEAPKPIEPQAQGEQQKQAEPVTELADHSIRVHVEVLDKLMNLVGELVLARNQILQHAQSSEDAGFLGTSQRINLITAALQEGIMKTRMQPIGNIWNKFPRVVRDLAVTCEKQVRIEMEGKETELDKTVIEAIRDPLTHMVRNSVDHGVESPEARKAAGKNPEGLLHLRAFHEGGLVNIEISDDGRGIDCAKVKQKAISLGLVTPEKAESMAERETINLIFLPGFSTAEKVSNVSGRGVGMDVVKSNIEKIGGAVDIQTSPAKGTTFRIKIPLTLAIVPALIVACGKNRYAIPLSSVVELVRIDADRAREQLEYINNAPVYRLRKRLLALLYLDQELQTAKAEEAKAQAINIVVVQAGDRQFGLIVDKVHDSQEIVVKPLGQQLKRLGVYSGATILGDGQVALILDVLSLAKRARVVTDAQERQGGEQASRSGDSTHQREVFLLSELPDGGRVAIPLSKVHRLEQVRADEIEAAGNVDVVQYRGGIMPLIYVATALPERRTVKRGEGGKGTELVNIVVYSAGSESVGLVVDRILDITEEEFSALKPASRSGVLGCLVIQDRVTEVLNLPEIVAKYLPRAGAAVAHG